MHPYVQDILNKVAALKASVDKLDGVIENSSVYKEYLNLITQTNSPVIPKDNDVGENTDPDDDNDDKKPSLLERIISFFRKLFAKIRAAFIIKK